MVHCNSSVFLYRYFSLWNNSDDFNETTSDFPSQDQSPMCWVLYKQNVRGNPFSKEQNYLAGQYPTEESERRSDLLAGMQTDLGSQKFLARRQPWSKYRIAVYGTNTTYLYLFYIYGKGDRSHTNTAFFSAEVRPNTHLGLCINGCQDFFT